MGKHVVGSAALREEPGVEQAAWLDLSQLARVEVHADGVARARRRMARCDFGHTNDSANL